MASKEPTWCNVADMVCVVSATWRRHVGADIVLGGKNCRHDADITSQGDGGKVNQEVTPAVELRVYNILAVQIDKECDYARNQRQYGT